MKKTILSLLGIITITSVQAVGDTYSIPASATLGRALTITEITPVSFGTIALADRGDSTDKPTVRLKPNGDTSISGTATDGWFVTNATVGEIRISGNPNTYVTISDILESYTATLSAAGGITSVLYYTPNKENRYPETTSILLDENGYGSFLQGGILTLPVNNIGYENYSGTYSITVSY